MTDIDGRRGLNAVEVIVVVAILAAFVLVLMMSLPRRLEVARRASCQRNLMQIGVALAIYDQDATHLPVVPELGGPASREGGPLKVLLEALGMPDLRELADAKSAPPKRPGFVVGERPVPGFVCASDPNATAGRFPAPVSYRANAGESPDGGNGPFAPGRRTSLAEIEAGDGVAFTAAFAERLAGLGRPSPSSANYAEAAAPLPRGGCPPPGPADWRGDAGSSWMPADWRSTLYNHAQTPGASPSCIAADARSAFMGTSSGHPVGVNVLTFDGAVKTYTTAVDPVIWRALASPGSPKGDETAAPRGEAPSP